MVSPLRYEIGRSNALANNTRCYRAISLIDPATISQLLRGFDLRNLVDTLRVSSVGHALEALRTAIHTAPMGLDVQFALADRCHRVDLTSRDRNDPLAVHKF